MSFNEGIGFIKEYLNTRADQIHDGKPLTWSGAAGNITKFNRSKESSQWNKLSKGDIPDRDVVAIRKVRTKIAFLCAAHRDLRKQFRGYGAGLKSPNDDRRRQAITNKFIAKVTIPNVEHYLPS